MITGPEVLADWLQSPSRTVEELRDLLESALPPLFFADRGDGELNDPGLFSRLIDRIAKALDEQRKWLASSARIGEDSWRTRLPILALGLAEHPETEPFPSLTFPALMEALSRVERCPARSEGPGRLTAADTWRWLVSNTHELARLPVSGTGLLTGAFLTGVIVGLAGPLRRFGVSLRDVQVTERTARVTVVQQALLEERGAGSRLGLGARLGGTATVRGGEVEIAISAHINDAGDAKCWEPYMTAIDRWIRRIVPSSCRARVRIKGMTGPPAIAQIDGDLRLGRGLSLKSRENDKTGRAPGAQPRGD